MTQRYMHSEPGRTRRGDPIARTAERAVAAQRILAGFWRRGGDGH